MQHDPAIGGFLQGRRTPNVVDVGVGVDNGFDREAMQGEALDDLFHVVTRVDDDGLFGDWVAEDDAITLEGTDWKNFDNFVDNTP